MKNITKDDKGITLIALITTVIIMLILLSVTTYTGINTYKHAQLNKFITQMQLLQAKVDDLVSSKTAEELDDLNLESGDEYQNIITNVYNSGNGEISSNIASEYKIFTKDDVLEILDVEDVQNDILVNFETREIVDTVGVEYDGLTYYTQYKLPGGQTIINNSNEPGRNLSFNLDISIDGLNATIEIGDIQIANATLSFAELDSEGNRINWKTITNYTRINKSEETIISRSGNYLFRLQDNTNNKNKKEKTVTIKLANKPKTDLELNPYNYGEDSNKWAYAQKDGENYVWIPRFAYDVNNNIKFIKGNSNIATDNTYIDENWAIHNKFTTESDVELTGMWISVSEEEMDQTGLNMFTLLNDSNRETLIEI